MTGLSHIEAAGAPFLGVERSLTGRTWRLASIDERQALAISQRLALPEVVGRVLSARGVGIDQAEAYLNPTLRDLLPDPLHLAGMKEAAERIARAVRENETIGLFGDYDVDGATGTALLTRFLRAAGGRVIAHIPDRLMEGYGPNTAAMLGLGEKGAKVIITVDCGTLAFEPLAACADAGLDVIVVDHHEAEPQLPRALAVVNPNRLDEHSPHGHLAAVGVAMLLTVAVNRALRESGWYGDARRVPDLMQWLDIVALGTVCDVVPLVGVNRALVAQGLKVAARRGNPGMAALADIAGLAERPDAGHFGYMLGPRVNAGGRVGQADLGLRLLTTDDPEEARELAAALDIHNRARQEIEAAVLRDAIEQVESRPDDGLPLVLAAGEGWHPGVVGIIAGRLKERYHRPACVIALEGGEGRGSGRSITGLDLGAAVIAARQAGLLIKGGGHAMAAGFTVARERVDDLRAFLGERLAAALASPIAPTLDLDGAVDAAGASIELAETLRQLGPFGSGNPEPRFAIPSARVANVRIVGSGHVSCRLVGKSGAKLKAIAFRAADSELGHALLAGDGMPFHFAGTLRPDSWQGNISVQLLIEDAAKAST
ncbi:MAG TPA: single-stranded-DNA-specific exonuclease RecJ [Magnetospirillaceae bacterium]|jgi:single-stranded-DNA-specific exonuclease